MKNIIKKSIITITAFAIMLTLAMPMSAEAARKKAPKLNKTKVTLTITKKKTKPAVQLKVKNAAGRKVKWTSSNKKVATVSKKGKIVAKKKGVAMITVKVKGSKTLRCKVTVKDNRKAVTKKPITNPEPSPSPNPTPNGECEHDWVEKEKVVETKYACTCGKLFDTEEQWTIHNDEVVENGETIHSFSPYEITETYYECSKCHKTK
ncbi:hypothetical protein C806_01702 [Lachnospiraceae bacterium 3-1]|nr:hypothetical protein C806_01702 [Lachnospiraceae bacterium 3-1]